MDAVERVANGMVAPLHGGWAPSRLFLPPTHREVPQGLMEARKIADESGLEKHEFFRVAEGAPDLLRLWISQEAVVTGPFSQLLLLAGSQLGNVHLRSLFLNVVLGEHQRVVDGIANRAHPWLLYRTCRSMGINLDVAQPLPFTVRFLEDLAGSFRHIECALGALGIGNERILIGEYKAIERCLDACLPMAEYRDFLHSNVSEDEEHCLIIENVVAHLSETNDFSQYLEGARRAVAARLDYYERLLAYWNKNGLPQHWHLRPLSSKEVS